MVQSMKNSVLFLLVAVLFIGMLFGCSKSEQPPVSTEMPTENIETGSQDLKDFVMLKTPQNLVTNTASTDDGMYKLRIDNGGTSILYYDYATATINYLSNQILPENDDTNTGWISSVEGGTIPLVAGENLFVVVMGIRPLPTVGIQATAPKVFKMDLTGANKTQVELPQNAVINPNSGIVFDGENIYFLCNVYDSETGLSSADALYSLNTESLEIVEVKKFDTTHTSYRIYGVYDDGLILQIGRVPEQYINAPREEQIINMEFEYTSLSMTDNSEKLLYEIERNTLSAVVDYKGGFYYCNNGEPVLYKLDLITGENTVAFDFGDALPVSEFDSFYIHGDIIDNYINISFVKNEPYEIYEYVIDLNEKSFKQIDLNFYEGSVEQPVVIAEQNEQYYVVLNGYIHYTQEQELDGAMVELPRIENYYSLILKQDYWNNTPNYIEFEDYVFPKESVVSKDYIEPQLDGAEQR